MGDPVSPPPGFVQDGPPSGFVLDSPTEKPSAVSRFFDPLDPRHLLHALYKPPTDPNEDSMVTFGKNVLGLVKDTGMAQVDQGKAALESWKKGNHADAVAQGLAALTPILGPMSQQAAEKFNTGDIAGGMGSLTAIALPEILHQAPGAIRATVKGAKAASSAVADFATSENVVKGLKRSSEGAVIGSAMHGNIPGVLTGGVARIAAEKLGEIGARRRAPVPPGTATPEMLQRAGIPLSAEEQALASEILAGVEPQEAAAATSVPRETVAPQSPGAPPAADFESIPLQGPAQGNVIPIRPSGNPLQPGISLPGGQGAAIPPEVPGLDAQRAFAEAMTGDPSGGQIPAPASPHPPAEAFEAAYRAKRAQVLADHFHANGISYEDLQHLTPGDLSSEQWEALLGKDPDTGVQFREPSQETIDQARVFLAGRSAAARSPKALAAAKELAGVGPQGSDVVPKAESAVKPAEMIELHRGGGPGNYYSTSRDFAREFTQSGQDSEVSSIKVPASQILDLGENTPEAGDVKAVDAAKSQAKASGAKGFYVDEGQGQPRSVFFTEKPSAKAPAPSTPEPKPKARAKAKTKKISDLMNDTGGK